MLRLTGGGAAKFSFASKVALLNWSALFVCRNLECVAVIVVVYITTDDLCSHREALQYSGRLWFIVHVGPIYVRYLYLAIRLRCARVWERNFNAVC